MIYMLFLPVLPVLMRLVESSALWNHLETQAGVGFTISAHDLAIC